MWKKYVQPYRPHMAIWRIACWITKATDEHSEYVILIAATTCYNGYTTAPPCYVTRTLPVLIRNLF